MSTRRLDSKSLQRAFARGTPARDLDFLLPSRDPQPAPPAEVPATEAAAAEAPPVPEPAPPPRRTRSRKKKTPEVADVPSEAVTLVEATIHVDVAPPPPVEVVAPAGPSAEAEVEPTQEVSAAPTWAPASPPWPAPRLRDKLLRRVEQWLAYLVFGPA